MAGMLADAAAGGPRPTVLALARTLGLANATFWRHYHDIATELRHHDAGARQSSAPRTRPPRQPLEAALSHLRRLTIDNAELRSELETARAITRIGRPDTASHG